MAEAVVEVVSAADDIASKIIAIMVRSFSERHHRQPNDEEVRNLLEELTEERIAELMGESFGINDVSSPDSAEEQEEEDEEQEKEDRPEDLCRNGSDDDESDEKGPTEKRHRSI